MLTPTDGLSWPFGRTMGWQRQGKEKEGAEMPTSYDTTGCPKVHVTSESLLSDILVSLQYKDVGFFG